MVLIGYFQIDDSFRKEKEEIEKKDPGFFPIIDNKEYFLAPFLINKEKILKKTVMCQNSICQ